VLDVVSAAFGLADHAHALVAAIPNPGQGEPPPGSKELMKILRWVAWSVSLLCVGGIFVVAGRMAVSHGRGQGQEHASGLAWVLGACILVGASSTLVGALIGGGS
jgi:predicted ABC-type sugar transport system permease subunit